jgi:hypothetical protein
VRSVRREVRLAVVDVWGVPVRLMTMERMSISIHGHWLRRALAIGVYLSRMISAVCERSFYVQLMQYFH